MSLCNEQYKPDSLAAIMVCVRVCVCEKERDRQEGRKREIGRKSKINIKRDCD